MSSMPPRVMAADQKDLNPSMGRVFRLIARWSCSTMLVQIFDLSDLNVGLLKEGACGH